MFTSREQWAVAEWNRIADYQNLIIKSTRRKIQRDNHHFWAEFMHTWDNDDWIDILKIVCHLHTETWEGTLTDQELATVERAISTLLKKQHLHTRVLDTKHHKGLAWQTAMVLREVSNRIAGIHCPNEDKETAAINNLY